MKWLTYMTGSGRMINLGYMDMVNIVFGSEYLDVHEKAVVVGRVGWIFEQ